MILELRQPSFARGRLSFVARVLDPGSVEDPNLAGQAATADRHPAGAIDAASLFIDDTEAPVIDNCVIQDFSSCTGINFGAIDLEGMTAIGINFSGSNLSGSNLDHADLVESNFGGARLGGTSFVEAKMIEASFYNADLRGANLTLAELGSASLVVADLEGANFRFSNLNGANLREAEGVTEESLLSVGASVCEATLPDGFPGFC